MYCMKMELKFGAKIFATLMWLLLLNFCHCVSHDTMILMAMDKNKKGVMMYISYQKKCKLSKEAKALLRNRTRAFMIKHDAHDIADQEVTIEIPDTSFRCVPFNVKVDSLKFH